MEFPFNNKHTHLMHPLAVCHFIYNKLKQGGDTQCCAGAPGVQLLYSSCFLSS